MSDYVAKLSSEVQSFNFLNFLVARAIDISHSNKRQDNAWVIADYQEKKLEDILIAWREIVLCPMGGDEGGNGGGPGSK